MPVPLNRLDCPEPYVETGTEATPGLLEGLVSASGRGEGFMG